MAGEAATTRRDLEARIIARAWEDGRYAEELRTNPKAVLERELGRALPDGVEVTVLEETPTSLYLVVPPKPRRAGDEMTDEELDRAAGGLLLGNTQGYCFNVPA
jgi:hypothetical protein